MFWADDPYPLICHAVMHIRQSSDPLQSLLFVVMPHELCIMYMYICTSTEHINIYSTQKKNKKQKTFIFSYFSGYMSLDNCVFSQKQCGTLCIWRWTGAPVTVSTIWTVRATLLGSRSSVSKPSAGPVAMNTVLGFRYFIFKLLFPRICSRCPEVSKASKSARLLMSRKADSGHATLGFAYVPRVPKCSLDCRRQMKTLMNDGAPQSCTATWQDNAGHCLFTVQQSMPFVETQPRCPQSSTACAAHWEVTCEAT